MKPSIEFLRSAGFKVFLGNSLYKKEKYLAGSDFSRKADLENMFVESDIQAIFCARGGYGSLRLLEKIDYLLVKDNPKIFVGYSDITALLLAIYHKTGLITFHGPMLKDIAYKDWAQDWQIQEFFCTSKGDSVSLESCKILSPGKAVGRLLGGNLSLLCHMIGTPYLPSFDGSILFFEDRGEPMYRMDRMLTHLRLSGLLEGVLGVIAGEFVQCGDRKDLDHLIHEIFNPLGIPVISGFPIGHGNKNIPLPIGVHVELDTHQMTLRFLESYLR